MGGKVKTDYGARQLQQVKTVTLCIPEGRVRENFGKDLNSSGSTGKAMDHSVV